MIREKLAKVARFLFPKIGQRIYKTLASVFIIAMFYELVWGSRNPCFACIGAVYGMGSYYKEGVRSGGARFVGTLLGGLVVIPFYYLYYTTPLGVPNFVYLIIGLFFVIYINRIFGAQSAIQPGTVVFFVVMFTVSSDRYVSYTLARIVDTGIGVLLSLAINKIFPAPLDKPQAKEPVHTEEEMVDVDASQVTTAYDSKFES